MWHINLLLRSMKKVQRLLESQPFKSILGPLLYKDSDLWYLTNLSTSLFKTNYIISTFSWVELLILVGRMDLETLQKILWYFHQHFRFFFFQFLACAMEEAASKFCLSIFSFVVANKWSPYKIWISPSTSNLVHNFGHRWKMTLKLLSYLLPKFRNQLTKNGHFLDKKVFLNVFFFFKKFH